MAKIVGVFAHPDDETFGPSGSLAKWAAHHEVSIVCCTNGNAGAGLKEVRKQELLKASRILNIANVRFLDFEDGSLSNNVYPDLVEQLKQILTDIQPDIVVTFAPNGVSGHIDHIVVTSVVNYLYERTELIREIRYFCLRQEEREELSDYFVFVPDGITKDEAHLVEDVSEVWPQKIAAIKQHYSQSHDGDRILKVLEMLPKEEYFLIKRKV